jgi:predicted acylesterase/phospholipase RssA
MNIGIVLSGGMAKGAYQIGALKAIREQICMEDIKCMSCASIGVLNGYSFIMDRLDEAEKMYISLCSNDSRLFINQILRSTILQHDIEKICTPNDVVHKDFFVSLLNMSNKTIEYRNLYCEQSDKLQSLLKASIAMPIYNRAVCVDGKNYFDGAMVDNIPVYPLLEKELDLIICVYFDEEHYLFENAIFDQKILKIIFPAKSVLTESLVYKPADMKRNIEQGYQRTHLILDMLLNEKSDEEKLKKKIAEINGGKCKKFRITGDIIVTNLNRILQKVIKPKIKN